MQSWVAAPFCRRPGGLVLGEWYLPAVVEGEERKCPGLEGAPASNPSPAAVCRFPAAEPWTARRAGGRGHCLTQMAKACSGPPGLGLL